MTTTTLILGQGKTAVAAFYSEQGAHGIGFFPAPEGKRSGDRWSNPETIENINESDCFLFIAATNPESIEAMIEQLKNVRQKMCEERGEIV